MTPSNRFAYFILLSLLLHNHGAFALPLTGEAALALRTTDTASPHVERRCFSWLKSCLKGDDDQPTDDVELQPIPQRLTSVSIGDKPDEEWEKAYQEGAAIAALKDKDPNNPLVKLSGGLTPQSEGGQAQPVASGSGTRSRGSKIVGAAGLSAAGLRGKGGKPDKKLVSAGGKRGAKVTGGKKPGRKARTARKNAAAQRSKPAKRKGSAPVRKAAGVAKGLGKPKNQGKHAQAGGKSAAKRPSKRKPKARSK